VPLLVYCKYKISLGISPALLYRPAREVCRRSMHYGRMSIFLQDYTYGSKIATQFNDLGAIVHVRYILDIWNVYVITEE
jgi:hypothetical protein